MKQIIKENKKFPNEEDGSNRQQSENEERTTEEINNPFIILGVPRSASQEEITKAWRTLTKQYHPDRNPGDSEAPEKFRKVQDAYNFLKNK